MKRYPEYKDSKYEWLGEVPEHWRVIAFKHCASIESSLVDPQLPEHIGRTLIAPNHVESGTGRILAEETARDQGADSGKYLYDQGAVVYSKIRPALAKACIPREGGLCSADMYPLTPRLDVDSRFLLYVLLSDFFTDQAVLASERVAMPKVNRETLNDFRIARPPLEEQRQLVVYLDRKTTEVDTLIRKKQALIARLGELRAALIHRAVTKGLDPDVPMKDSDVEWLGEVPEHWAVADLGYRYEVQLGRMLNASRSEGDHLRPYLRVYDVQWGEINTEELPLMDFPPDAQARYRLQEGDLLVNEGGSYVGRSAIWRGELEECYYQKALHRLRPFRLDSDTAEFLYYVMEMATRNGVFVAGGNQTTIDHLTAEKLRRYEFAFPTFEEQERIVAHIKLRTSRIDAIRDRERRLIDKLRELRTSLISEVVTGKIDVRVVPASNHAAADATEANAFLWWVLANYVLGQMAHVDRFGRITLVKVLFVLIYELRLRLTDKKYRGPHERWDFGPHDPEMTHALEASLEREGYWKKVKVPDERQVRYVPGPNADDPKGHFDKYWGDRKAEIDRVIRLFSEVTSHGRAAERAEIIATLYGAWNDLLLAGASPTDDEIVRETRENWHPHKLTIAEERWRNGLVWMREQGLVPTGFGEPVVARKVAA